MKNSLADDLSNILSSLRKQNKEITKTLGNLKKTKSMYTLPCQSMMKGTNPETKEKGKSIAKNEVKEKKKTKSFLRCNSCQLIDTKDKHNLQKKEIPARVSKVMPRKASSQIVKTPSKKTAGTKRLTSPKKSMTKVYYNLLTTRKVTKKN